MARLEDAAMVLELHEVGTPSRPLDGFLALLLHRCRADGAALDLRTACGDAELWQAGMAGAAWPANQVRARMRLNRVYALDELRDTAASPAGLASRPVLTGGRAIRVGEPKAWDSWLFLTRSSGDFASADSAILSGLAPHLLIALRHRVAVAKERVRSAAMEEALARAGVRWSVYCANGRADAAQESSADQALHQRARQLLANGAALQPEVAPSDLDHALDHLLLPIPGYTDRLLALSRHSRPATSAAIDCLEQAWRLSANEARLCFALARGRSLAEAAAHLGLTLETARNYTKRIYAKTGARGMPDLVRRVITHVAWLA